LIRINLGGSELEMGEFCDSQDVFAADFHIFQS